jgi:hypothetical protein
MLQMPGCGSGDRHYENPVLLNTANIHLKTGVDLPDLPGLLRMEIERISKMRYS